MYRKVSIGWMIQRSGRYALKGITVQENDRSYDSTSAFREEDAKWLTKVLGAEADIELASNNTGERNPEGYPDWARKSAQETNHDAVPPLDWERASATLLRHYLVQMMASMAAENGGHGLEYLTSEASAALMATEAGTYYSLEEARTIIERRGQKLGRAKGR